MAEPLNATGVYAAISAVTADLGKVGIAKSGVNEQQRYRFRGIDQVYAVLNPALVKAGLVIVPRVVDRTVSERVTPKGGTLFYTVLTVDYDLVAVADGSRIIVRTVGEAMDSGDKSTNKAMSASYKYMAILTFCIPVEGDADADEQTHEVAPAKPDGYDAWLAGYRSEAAKGLDALQAAWVQSSARYRSYLVSVEPATQAAIKAQAASVGGAQ